MGNKNAKPNEVGIDVGAAEYPDVPGSMPSFDFPTVTPGYTTEGALEETEPAPEPKTLRVIEVSGCGVNQCNGRYYEQGVRNGSPYYEHFDHGDVFCIMYHAAAWRLARKSRSESDEGIRWFYVSDDGYFKHPASTGWQLDRRGQWPPPAAIDVKSVPNPFLEIQEMILSSEVRRWFTRRIRLKKNRTYNIINLVNTFRVTTEDLPGLLDDVIDGMDEMDHEAVLRKKGKKRKRKPKKPNPSLADAEAESLTKVTTTTTTTTVTKKVEQKVEVFKSTSPKARADATKRPRADSRAEGQPEEGSAGGTTPVEEATPHGAAETPKSPKARKAKKKKKKRKNRRTPERTNLPATPTVPDVPFPDDQGSEEMEGFSWEGISRVPTTRHSVQELHVGGVVEIHGLTGRAAAVFNSRLGVLHRFLEDKNAWGVMLDEDTECILLPANLRRVIPQGWEEVEHESGVKVYQETQRSLDIE